MTTSRELALLRVVAQRLVGTAQAGPVDAVRWLTALQAQQFDGALTSIALRTQARARDQVVAAFNAGDIVKSWPMRGTLHVVAAEDLGWMLELTSSRILAGAARRRARLDLTDSTLERAKQLAADALTDRYRLRRSELFAVWDDAGLPMSGQRGYHMLWYVAQVGTVCFGPIDEKGEQLIVLVSEWITHPRRLERDEALGEWVERYFRGHGPATPQDFMRWTGLTAADTRIGLDQARPQLANIEVGGTEYWLDPRTPDLYVTHRNQAARVLLLPGFDEFMLGYRDRGAMLPTRFADLIVPGGNGMFAPTVVAGGQVIGTWKHTGRGNKRTIAATPFTSFSATQTTAIHRAYAALP